MSEKKEGEENAEGAAPKSKKKLIIIIVAVLVLLGGGGGAAMMLGGKKVEKGEEEVQEEPKKLQVVDLGQFVVNLSETSAFLKVRIKIEYDEAVIERQLKEGGEGGGGGHGGGASGGEGEKKEGALHPHLAMRDTQIRDAIIRILSSKRAEEMLTADGKEKLKEELVEAINESTGMEEGPVTNVYFTEFIIQ